MSLDLAGMLTHLKELAGFCPASTGLWEVVIQFLLHLGKRAIGLAVTALV